MTHTKGLGSFFSSLLFGLLLALHTRAASGVRPALPAAPSRVNLVFVDLPPGDPQLSARIQSLFPAGTLVASRRSAALDAESVLRPSEPGALSVWIRFTGPNRVRIYLTAAEAGAPRYLLREVILDRGLDEVGGESLAQIVHSAAEALWSGEQQATDTDVTRTLAADVESASSAPTSPAAAPSVEPRSSPPSLSRAQPPHKLSENSEEPRSAPLPASAIGLGATFGARFGAAEGWLSEPGGFVSARYGNFSLRMDAAMVLPAEMNVSPLQVRLTGADGGLRVGWQAANFAPLRVRLEMGIGAWAGRWRALIIANEPSAHVNPARSFFRPYAVATIAIEWVAGPIWVAPRAELRSRFNRVEYVVAGQSASASSGYLEPGGVLEVGFLLERGSR